MEVTGIFARHSPYLDRHVQIGVASGRAVSVSFPETPDANAESDHQLLDRVEAYLSGTVEDDFDDVEIALTVPTDRRAVLETVRSIPYGGGVTVERLAGMTPELDPDDEADLELVRDAIAENPLPLLLPDHRVSDGPSAAPPPVERRLRSLEGIGS